jgi:parallel beta-helix repeat protein
MYGIGNNHLFADNYFHDVVQETTDASAFYTYCTWANLGNAIVNNTFRRCYPIEQISQNSPACAIYLDCMGSGWNITDNTLEDIEDGIFVGGGRQNIIERNTFINCSNTAVHIDPKGLQERPNGMPQYCNDSATNPGLFLQELNGKYNFSTPSSRWNLAYGKRFNLSMSCAPAFNIVSNNQWCKVRNKSTFTDFYNYAQLLTSGGWKCGPVLDQQW